MKKCPQCGFENADDAVDCKECLETLSIDPNLFAGSNNFTGLAGQFKLVVREGLRTGIIFSLLKSVINIGRVDIAQFWEPEVDLTGQEQDGSYYISRRHARLRLDSGRVFLEDIGSLHGTTVEGKGKVALREMEIHPGDRIRLGRSVVLSLERDG